MSIWDRFTGEKQRQEAERQKQQQQQEAQQKAQGERQAAEKERSRSPAQEREQAAKDREKQPGPAERYVTSRPEVLDTALKAKAERDKPPQEKPTKLENQPPTKPQPGPVIQTPGGGTQRMSVAPSPAKPVEPEKPRQPTNADKMLDRAGETAKKERPPIKSYAELHPNSGKDISR